MQVVGHAFFLEAVAVDNRIVQRQGKLKDGRHRVRDEGDRAEEEACPHIQNGRNDKGQADNGHIRIGIRRQGQHQNHNHRNKSGDHVDFLFDQFRRGVDHRGGKEAVITRQDVLNGRKHLQAGLILLGIIKGNGKEGGSLVIVFGSVVKIDALNTFQPFDGLVKCMGILIRNIGHHEVCRPIGNKLVFHHVQTFPGRGIGRQIGRQVILHLYPVPGKNRKDNRNDNQKKNKVPPVNDCGGNLHHEIILFCRCCTHTFYIPLFLL